MGEESIPSEASRAARTSPPPDEEDVKSESAFASANKAVVLSFKDASALEAALRSHSSPPRAYMYRSYLDVKRKRSHNYQSGTKLDHK